MEEIGHRYEEGKAFVPNLLLAARAMKGCLEILKPLLTNEAATLIGTAVIGTVKGDLHDIGKNLVASMLEGRGFKVINLGADVSKEKFIEAAKENPSVTFAHATGTKAHTEGLDNFGNAFASIYEGRYLAGVAAGMKLKELVDAGAEPKVGYVGAFTYAEVISGYTSWFLGVRSIVPEATMEVQFTGSWYDEALEKEAAQTLINNGAVLLSQHADSMGAPTACEEAGIPDVSYNGSTLDACPNTFIVSSRIDWTNYFYTFIKKNRDCGR